MKKQRFEFFVGLFVALGILCLAILSIRMRAVFTNGTGIRSGSPILIAGVEVGRVEQIALKDYEAQVVLKIQPGIVLQKDSIASIKTKGLIGEKYIEITPGGAEQTLGPNGVIRDTEPAMDFEAIVSKFVQGNVSKPAQ